MRQGFTLIELLIVVAIIAILAAIAVPNFLEAQIRSKVSRARADMRSLATALEAYSVDNNTYPPLWPSPMADSIVRMYTHFLWEHWGGRETARCTLLTTPVAYMTKVPRDPFVWREGNPDAAYRNNSSFWYINFQGAYRDKDKPLGAGDTSWDLFFHPSLTPLTDIRVTGADGPARPCAWTMASPGPGSVVIMGIYDLGRNYPTLSTGRIQVYDPTNGTTSKGGIIDSSAGFLGN